MEDYVRGFLPLRKQVAREEQLNTADALLNVGYCPACGVETQTFGVSTDFEEINSLPHLEEHILTIATSQPMAVCQQCGIPVVPEHLRWVVWFHFLPEVQRDFLVGFDFTTPKHVQCRYYRVDLDGDLESLPSIRSEADFHRLFGTYFTVREVWNEFMARHRRIPRIETLTVQPGYDLCLLPPRAEVNEEAMVEIETFVRGMVEKGIDFYQSLTDVDDQDYPFPEHTYHEWLEDHLPALQNEELVGYVFVNTACFIDVLAAECERRGFACNVVEGRKRRCRLARDEYSIEMDWLNVLLQMVHTGMNFHQSIKAYAMRDLELMERVVALGERIRTTLHSTKCTLEEGSTLVVENVAGTGTSGEVNLLSLANKIDVYDPRQVEEFLRTLIGYDPATGQIGERHVSLDHCYCGRPAYLGVRLRPRSFFAPLGRDCSELYAIEIENDLLICYTIECEKHVAYAFREQLPTSLDDLRERRMADLERNVFNVDELYPIELPDDSLYILSGYDVSAIMLSPCFVRGVLEYAHRPIKSKIIYAYAPYTNILSLSWKPSDQERRRRIRRLAEEIGSKHTYGPGVELEYSNRLELTEPAKGKITIGIF